MVVQRRLALLHSPHTSPALPDNTLQGVAFRNTPNFEDRNPSVAGPAVGDMITGSVVPGDGGLYYLQTSLVGYIPFYRKDSGIILAPHDQARSYQVIPPQGARLSTAACLSAPPGIAYRLTANFGDTKPGQGPIGGQIVIGA